jgi:16S rRNA (guanine1207-N2)-methyltransferase
MASPRFVHALETGAFELPEHARVVLLEPSADADLTGLADCDVVVQQTFRPTYDAYFAAGADVTDDATNTADIVHVTLPRSRDLARGLIAKAEKLASGGVVMVDGAKTDGIDATLKAVKARVGIAGQVAKAHGKLFWFTASNAFQDWTLPDPTPVKDGWITQPGIFSADGPDAGSQALVAALPKTLKGSGADLGGGWGYLTKHLLDLPGVAHVDLVEADKRALGCAMLNIADSRAALHWADATDWGTAGTLDWVVMNPPFHTSRTPDADLGKAFIRSAARLLKPKGQLIMVANRHLPYETTLAASFVHVQELDGDARFKILHAEQPRPPERPGRNRRR